MKLHENGRRILWVDTEYYCCHEDCEQEMRRNRKMDPTLPTQDEFLHKHVDILHGYFRCEGCTARIRNAQEGGSMVEGMHFL